MANKAGKMSPMMYTYIINDTVDGRNPAPVEVGSLFHFLQGFYIQGGAGFQPSTVPHGPPKRCQREPPSSGKRIYEDFEDYINCLYRCSHKIHHKSHFYPFFLL